MSGVFSVQSFVPPAPCFPSVCPSVSSFFVPSSSSSVFGSTSFHPPFRCPALVSVLALSAVTPPFSAPVSLFIPSTSPSPVFFFFFFFFLFFFFFFFFTLPSLYLQFLFLLFLLLLPSFLLPLLSLFLRFLSLHYYLLRLQMWF